MTGRPHPRFEDHRTHEEYSQACRTWRALERDDRLTLDEQAARFAALGWEPPADWGLDVHVTTEAELGALAKLARPPLACSHPSPINITSLTDPQPLALCTGCGEHMIMDDDGYWTVPEVMSTTEGDGIP